jgi:hypothetical protein
MTEMYSTVLDNQAKWQLMMEMERYHTKLRHIRAIHHASADELARVACQEHLDRLTDIYAQAGARQTSHVQPWPWSHDSVAVH